MTECLRNFSLRHMVSLLILLRSPENFPGQFDYSGRKIEKKMKTASAADRITAAAGALPPHAHAAKMKTNKNIKKK